MTDTRFGSSDTDSLEVRMKSYESLGEFRLMFGLPLIARLDGHNFNKFTKNLAKPFDKRLSTLMIGLAQFLAKKFEANLAYTQSDEITLAWTSYDNFPSDNLFNRRIVKASSVMAGAASAFFNQHNNMGNEELYPHFDCRLWTVPSLNEAANVFFWRELDGTRNSITMAARTLFSHQEILNKSSKELVQMMYDKGIHWPDYPAFFKRGTYIKRVVVEKKFSCAEIEKLPPKHDARSNPNLAFKRNEYQIMEWEPLTKCMDNFARLKSSVGKQLANFLFGEE